MTLVATTPRQPKAVKTGKTAKGTARNLNAQTRLINAWAYAKENNLKGLTKACFGVQNPNKMEKHPLLVSLIETVRPFAESNSLSAMNETMKKTNGKIYGGSKNGYSVYINNVKTDVTTEAVNIYNAWKELKESTTLIRTMPNRYWAEHKANCLPLGSFSNGIYHSFLLATQGKLDKITNNYSVSPTSYLEMLNKIEVIETQEEYNNTMCFVYVVKCEGAKTVTLIKHPTTENLWYEMFE